MIERKILIGVIVSTDYCKQVRNIWDSQLIESPTIKRIIHWAWEYFQKHNEAPGKQIELIFFQKAKKLSKDIAEEIELEILPSLSEEYELESFNLQYMLEETQKYFSTRRLQVLSENLQNLVSADRIVEAETMAMEYKPVANSSETGLDLRADIALDRIDKAFRETNHPLIYYPKHLGEFWNHQLVKGGFVALMASEKRGKTFWLMDLAIRACRQKKNVVFFQAGDMTESQQLKRICVYLAKKSDQARYCGEMWEPVRDCVWNQRNDCERTEREGHRGIFEKRVTFEFVRMEVSQEELIKASLDRKNIDYKPCSNCSEYKSKPWGAAWIKQVDVGEDPLTPGEARSSMTKFFEKNKRSFKLSSHSNGTLSIAEMKALLNIWEKQDGFVPDVIVIDYADLLVPGITTEFRHQQNQVWKDLRSLSQEKGQPLVITATQADAKSYDQNRLKMSNFSEDKRKYAHCTAMYGLNQDVKGREKKLGLMRINEIVIREGESNPSNEVIVLQNLRRGRPFIGSML